MKFPILLIIAALGYDGAASSVGQDEITLNEAKSFLAHVANCSSAELEFDTCLIEKTIGLMIDASGARDAEASESNSFHRLRALSSTTSTTEQELEHDGCDKPDMDTAAIDFFVNEAATVCYDKDGIQVDADEINQAVNAFSTIFSDNHQCWDAACDDSPYNEDRGGDDPFVGDGEITALGKCRVVVGVVVGGWCCCFWRLLLLVDSNIITRIPRIYHGSLTVPELPPFKIQTKSLTAAACLSTRPRA